MNNENIEVITNREELYHKCKNIEQLFDNYYLPLLDKHYSKTYKLQQDNHQLKKKIKTYEDPEDLTLIFMYCDEKAKDKIKELKKQLEEKEKKYIPGEYAKNEYIKTFDENILLKNQQKEFINYLEDEISKLKKEYGNYVYDDYSEEKGKYDTCIEIIQKYKEIIGGKDE